jgi:hypothetical protein
LDAAIAAASALKMEQAAVPPPSPDLDTSTLQNQLLVESAQAHPSVAQVSVQAGLAPAAAPLPPAAASPSPAVPPPAEAPRQPQPSQAPQPQPYQAEQSQPRPTAQSLLNMLRGAATPDHRAGEPAVPPRPLLEVLRASSAAAPMPRDGLLAVLAQPAVWDLPLVAPQAPGPLGLAGRPIPPPWDDGVPAPTAPPATPLPKAVPAASVAAEAARPVWLAPPEAAPAPAGSLAEMFRLVSAPPCAVPEPAKQTESLKDILRGLHPDRRA